MLAKIHTFSLLGIEAPCCRGRGRHLAWRTPKTTLVGLAESAVKESLHRVERAIANSGYLRPQDRVVINMAPAELPKQAASFDLPIALGMLAASGQFQSEIFEQYAVVGEVSLEGAMRPVKGALSMAMAAARRNYEGLYCRLKMRPEAAVVEEIEVIPVSSLSKRCVFRGTNRDLPCPEPIR